MKNLKFFPFAEASCLAPRANLLAAKVRADQHLHRDLSDRIQRWEKVFSLPLTLLLTGSFLLLAVADCFLLSEMYRQLSQLVCGDPDKLRWTIAIALNTIVGICSHEISLTARSGAFFDWEVVEYSSHTPLEITYSRVLKARADRRYGLIIKLAILAMMVTLILHLRGILIEDSITSSPLDTGTVMIGLGFLVFEIAAGCYLLYLLEYLGWCISRSILNRRIQSRIRQVSKIDRTIHELWVHIPSSTAMTADIRDALGRFLFRRHDFTYCDLSEDQPDRKTTITALPRIPTNSTAN